MSPLLRHSLLTACTALLAMQPVCAALAGDTAALADERNPAPAYASVQENLRAMDKDGDGQVTVLELRAYLEARHGKDYQQEVLEDLAASAKGKRCSTPFAQSFY